MQQLKWSADWKLNLSPSTFWQLGQSSCNAFLSAVCQGSGKTCLLTTRSCVEDFEAACNKSCKLNMKVHENRGIGTEVVTWGENGSFWKHRCCFFERTGRNTRVKILGKNRRPQTGFFWFESLIKMYLVGVIWCDTCFINRVKHENCGH